MGWDIQRVYKSESNHSSAAQRSSHKPSETEPVQYADMWTYLARKWLFFSRTTTLETGSIFRTAS